MTVGAPHLLNTAEACLFLGIKRSSLYELVRKRQITFYKSQGGKFTYFRRRDLEEWMLCYRFRRIDRDI